jgi:hypothetical protein
MRNQRGLRAALLAGVAAAGVVIATAVPAAQAGSLRQETAGICASAANPQLAARISRGVTAALAGRSSAVGLTASDPAAGLTCALHAGEHFDAASVIKVTIISALLLKEGGVARLTKKQRSLAWLMITQSNNDAATALWNDVGMADMQKFLDRADMRHTVLNVAWGLTQLTAHDELTLLRLLVTPGKVLGNNSRKYVLWLMANVVSYERWGVSAGAPSDVTVHLKNGWLPYPTLWHINSIGAFTGKHIDYQIVVLTSGNPSMQYGIDTVQGAAEVINKDLAAK